MTFHKLPIESYLPHRRGMLFIDELMDYDQNSRTGVFKSVLQSNKNYCSQESTVESHWFIEIMAQACAIVYQLQKDQKTPVEVGFLVTIKNFETNKDQLYVGDDILIKSCFNELIYNFGYFDCEIISGQEQVCNAYMSFMISPDT